MSAVANTPKPSSTSNGTSPLLPPIKNDHVSNPPPYMTMNGNKPPSRDQQSIPAAGRSFSSTASNHVHVAPGLGISMNALPTVKQRHKYKNEQHSNNSNLNATTTTLTAHNHSVGLSGGSPADNDATYCTEIARRSAARAALHLGMEGMEGEALDVLGSVLLGYMDQASTTISADVETSGRPSAHSNAYDALNAVDICTAPAATQLLGSSSTPSSVPGTASRLPLPGNQSKIKEGQDNATGWEGLASFLFGPNWFSIPLQGEDEEDATNKTSADKEASASDSLSLSLLGGLVNKDGTAKILQTNGVATVKKPGGKTILPSKPPDHAAINVTKPKAGKGKQLPNLMKGAAENNMNMKSVSFSLERQKSNGSGNVMDPAVPGEENAASNDAGLGRWHAPYLHSVPSFPLVTTTTDDQDILSKNESNPHHRLQQGSLSLHDLATEMEACREEPPATKRSRRGSAGTSTNSSDQDGKASAVAKARATRLKEEAADRAMRAALRIPDDVYSTKGTVWGSILNEKDNSPSSDDKKEPVVVVDGDKKSAAAKKLAAGDDGNNKAKAVKFDESSATRPTLSSSNTGSEHAASRISVQNMPPYIPKFLPPFPTDEYSAMTSDRLSASVSTSAVMGDVMSRMVHNREKRKHSSLLKPEDEKSSALASERDSVRRSMIGLEKSAGFSYWGSELPEKENGSSYDKDKNQNEKSFTLSNATVAPGDGGVGDNPQQKPTKNKSGLDASQVLPLGRASGSRLSKILEGSMNVS